VFAEQSIARQFKVTKAVVQAALWTPPQVTAYSVFAARLRSQDSASFEGLTAEMTVRYTLARWQAMPDEQKALFEAAAQEQNSHVPAAMHTWEAALNLMFQRTKLEKARLAEQREMTERLQILEEARLQRDQREGMVKLMKENMTGC
jgi:hypothetical protein